MNAQNTRTGKGKPGRGLKPVNEGNKPAPRWLDRNQQATMMREVRKGSAGMRPLQG